MTSEYRTTGQTENQRIRAAEQTKPPAPRPDQHQRPRSADNAARRILDRFPGMADMAREATAAASPIGSAPERDFSDLSEADALALYDELKQMPHSLDPDSAARVTEMAERLRG